MKKFLKTLAMVIAILALIVLIVGGLDMWLNSGALLGQFVEFVGVKGLTAWGVLIIAAGALVIAVLISPKGVSKAVDRVVEGAGHISEGAGKLLAKTSVGLASGIAAGLGLGGAGKWLILAGLVGLTIYLWPDSKDKKSYDSLSAEPSAKSSASTATEVDSNFTGSEKNSSNEDSYRQKRIKRAIARNQALSDANGGPVALTI